MPELFLLGMCAIFIYFIYLRIKFKKFPPDPTCYPILGKLEKSMITLRKKCRRENGIHIKETKRVVYVNQEDFSLLPLCGRFLPNNILNGNIRGIAIGADRAWTKNPWFCISNVQAEFCHEVPVETLMPNKRNAVMKLSESWRTPLFTALKFNIPVINIFCGITERERDSLKNPQMLKIIGHYANEQYSTNNMHKSLAAVKIHLFFELPKMFPNKSGYQNYQKDYIPAMRSGSILCVTDPHKQHYSDEFQKDLISYYYLRNIAKILDPKLICFGTTRDGKLNRLHKIFMGGSYHNNIIGSHIQKRAKLQECQMLPFANTEPPKAVLQLSPIVSPRPIKEILKDEAFHGYIIPKDKLGISDLYVNSPKPNSWRNSVNFRQERILNEDKMEMSRRPNLFAFSTERRVSPWMPLARDELFLSTMRLFQSSKNNVDPNKPISVMLTYERGAISKPIKDKSIF